MSKEKQQSHLCISPKQPRHLSRCAGWLAQQLRELCEDFRDRKKKFMLVSVIGREIHTVLFDNKYSAQSKMMQELLSEMRRAGIDTEALIQAILRDERDRYDESDLYGCEPYSAFLKRNLLGTECDWLIVAV